MLSGSHDGSDTDIDFKGFPTINRERYFRGYQKI